MHRRTFLSASAGAALALGTGFWRAAFSQPALPGAGPYGGLGTPDANGIRLPDGFRSRVIASSGLPVGETGYTWHISPDGAATFPAPDGGWWYACNSETVGNGGVGAIRFDSTGQILDAYRILSGTNANCAGGPTPWGTWLSCEEFDFSGEVADLPLDPGALVAGMVWECDPTRPGQGLPRPAMGRFSHEAAAVDPVSGRVLLTEDQGDSRLYAFHPDRPGDLSTGSLHALVVDPSDPLAHTRGYGPFDVGWIPVPDPLAIGTSVRAQVPTAARFSRGEGMWIDSGVVYFSTTGDERIWALTLGRDGAADRLECLYWGRDTSRWEQSAAGAPLWDPDNITVSPAGDIYAAEDSGDLRISIITAPDATGDRTVTPFLQLDRSQHPGTELTGPCFSPDGNRLFFSSQRSGPTGQGITFEVTGPFRSLPPAEPGQPEEPEGPEGPGDPGQPGGGGRPDRGRGRPDGDPPHGPPEGRGRPG
jgi:uncharacterized protein